MSRSSYCSGGRDERGAAARDNQGEEELIHVVHRISIVVLVSVVLVVVVVLEVVGAENLSMSGLDRACPCYLSRHEEWVQMWTTKRRGQSFTFLHLAHA